MQRTKQILQKILLIVISLMIGFVVSIPITNTVFGSDITPAYAGIIVGNEEIEGYQPSDIINTNVNVNLDNAPEVTNKAETTVTKLVRVVVPILMIACVCIIIYNAIKNIFLPREQRTKMGDIIKNMFIQFFFIFFAWIIVELIVFVVTGGETILFSILMS